MLWTRRAVVPTRSRMSRTPARSCTPWWLSTGAAILDGRTLRYGSHHQKIMIVKGVKGLIAYCGGVDINEDLIVQSAPPTARRSTTCTAAPDPAAHELLKIFLRTLAGPYGPVLTARSCSARKRMCRKASQPSPPLGPRQVLPLARPTRKADPHGKAICTRRSAQLRQRWWLSVCAGWRTTRTR